MKRILFFTSLLPLFLLAAATLGFCLTLYFLGNTMLKIASEIEDFALYYPRLSEKLKAYEKWSKK